MTLKDKMQTAVDKMLNEANGSTETSKIVAVCADVAEKANSEFTEWVTDEDRLEGRFKKVEDDWH